MIFIGGSHSTVNVSVICHLRSKGKKMLNFSCRINENKETGIEFFSIQVCRPPEF